MNRELKYKWIDALKSGEYKKIEGEMTDGKDGRCVLGVLCDIAGKLYDFSGMSLNDMIKNTPDSVWQEYNLSFVEKVIPDKYYQLMSYNDRGTEKVSNFEYMANWIKDNIQED